jgi:p-hydroxybenzoate 3-monooxygenase
MRTDVAIIGAGPAGLLLAHLLAQDGIESIVVESRTKEYVAARIRAGILESSSVDLLRNAGLGAGIEAAGDEHRGIYLQWPAERHHLDFVDLTGRSVWVYGQTQLQADLAAASDAAGRPVYYGASGTALADPDSGHPSVTFTDADGNVRRIDAVAVAGCDGSFGPSRAAVPPGHSHTWERVYPYSWLGILADVAPSTDELIYAWHPDGFALHSMRSPAVSRLYLQVPNGTDAADWPDDRIWTALATRLGHGQDGWQLTPGPVTADVALLAPALGQLVRKNDTALTDAYSGTALRRVWRCEHFSWWMTSMLHTSGDPFDAQLQLSQLRWVTSSAAGAAGLAENYAGLPIGF